MGRTARISAKVEPTFRTKLDTVLAEAGWDEAEYVRRAVEEYFPKLMQYVQSLRQAGPP